VEFNLKKKWLKLNKKDTNKDLQLLAQSEARLVSCLGLASAVTLYK